MSCQSMSIALMLVFSLVTNGLHMLCPSGPFPMFRSVPLSCLPHPPCLSCMLARPLCQTRGLLSQLLLQVLHRVYSLTAGHKLSLYLAPLFNVLACLCLLVILLQSRGCTAPRK